MTKFHGKFTTKLKFQNNTVTKKNKIEIRSQWYCEISREPYLISLMRLAYCKITLTIMFENGFAIGFDLRRLKQNHQILKILLKALLFRTVWLEIFRILNFKSHVLQTYIFSSNDNFSVNNRCGEIIYLPTLNPTTDLL